MAVSQREAMQSFGKPEHFDRNAEYVHDDQELDLGENPAEVIKLSDYRAMVDPKDIDAIINLVSEGAGKLDNYLRVAVNTYLTESFGVTDGVKRNKIVRDIFSDPRAAEILKKYDSRFETAKLQFQREHSQQGFKDILPELTLDLELLLKTSAPKIIEFAKATRSTAPEVAPGTSWQDVRAKHVAKQPNALQRAGNAVRKYFGFVNDEDVE